MFHLGSKIRLSGMWLLALAGTTLAADCKVNEAVTEDRLQAPVVHAEYKETDRSVSWTWLCSKGAQESFKMSEASNSFLGFTVKG